MGGVFRQENNPCGFAAREGVSLTGKSEGESVGGGRIPPPIHPWWALISFSISASIIARAWLAGSFSVQPAAAR